ncbi:Protein spinster 1 [Mortierella sp. GBA35]|nr:Protein spinster 1 [Mortierella sp. GBA35]
MSRPQHQQQAPPPQLLLSIPSMVQTNLCPIAPIPSSTLPTVPVIEQQLKGVNRIRQKLTPAFLYVVSTAQFFDIANGASVAVAILTIAQDLDFAVTEVLWILNAYTISFAGLLLFPGRLSDLFGYRRIFKFGLFWIALWSLVVSFSTSPIMLILARALQGVGAASTIPTATALIATNYPVGPERTKALSIFGAFGGLVKTEKPKVDFLGAITATLGITCVVYYISTGVEYGWASPKTLPIFFLGLLLIISFLYLQSHVLAPLIPLRIWKV